MTSVDSNIVARLFEVVDFDLSLSEALITTMEGQANWLIRRGDYSSDAYPNFVDFMYFDAMEKVKPLGVGIIR